LTKENAADSIREFLEILMSQLMENEEQISTIRADYKNADN
jgi:hypothetical protein